MEQKIKDALDQIRPFLQRDGGDIEFVEYTDDNIVRVRLQGCLIHEMRLVSSNEPYFDNGHEVFVNMGDHFKRFVNWKEVTSEE